MLTGGELLCSLTAHHTHTHTISPSLFSFIASEAHPLELELRNWNYDVNLCCHDIQEPVVCSLGPCALSEVFQPEAVEEQSLLQPAGFSSRLTSKNRNRITFLVLYYCKNVGLVRDGTEKETCLLYLYFI